ncbi:dynamin family protein [uncultured Desulfosarcina sp.]|uniref:dynamin family protein n=1 Tax=uncultured Desulfosarcina sp. TaxID=218289 RepID=UPI0029C8DE9F|nr:dynamin family protein [uncultured Desulfosarcina sp.]
MDQLYDAGTIEAVARLKDAAVRLSDLLVLDCRPAVDAWQQAVEARLLPRLKPDFPLVAAICGGGSSGKSTLFNALVGRPLSPTGGRAGINRRPLIAISTQYKEKPGVADALCDPFGCAPKLLEAMEELASPGDPLLCYQESLPPGLALLDTPDFDTGAGGSYQNREMAERSLSAADVLIYIFTNANYNNRDNTDFIARMLTTVGTRNSFLVYRVYPSFSDEEVLDHAGTVGRNLYGEGAGQHVLGVYRAVEDNRVAAGEQPVGVVPTGDGRTGLMEALSQMDPRQVKGELHRSIFTDVIHQGRGFVEAVRQADEHLAAYLEGLRTIQRSYVQEALSHLPMDAVVRRFSQIWRDTDPSHVKFMRKTGQVVEGPLQMALRAAKWIRGRKAGKKEAAPEGAVAAAMEADLVQAANGLRKAAVDPELMLRLSRSDPAVDQMRELLRRLTKHPDMAESSTRGDTATFRISLPPALADAQEALRGANWSATLEDMLARQESPGGLTGELEEELQRLVREQRARMTTFDQIRQTFAAMLNIIPATAAVTYVLSTGDPVGAVGIKVKLAGLFGLNDLYALVAIPATAGMKKADLKQLEALLAPVARAWLTHKLTAIEALFEEKITGALLQKGQAVSAAAADDIQRMDQSLAHCGRVLEKTA